MPARVRAALYRVAARIPGIEVLGPTHDGIGRPALAIALNDHLYKEREELLFDPRTAKLLGEREAAATASGSGGPKAGTVLYESTYLRSGITQQIGEQPATSTAAGRL